MNKDVFIKKIIAIVALFGAMLFGAFNIVSTIQDSKVVKESESWTETVGRLTYADFDRYTRNTKNNDKITQYYLKVRYEFVVDDVTYYGDKYTIPSDLHVFRNPEEGEEHLYRHVEKDWEIKRLYYDPNNPTRSVIIKPERDPIYVFIAIFLWSGLIFICLYGLSEYLPKIIFKFKPNGRLYLERESFANRFAIQFAKQKFRAVRKKNHFLEVYDILRNEFKVLDENTLIAGILHDTLEDTNASFDEIEHFFSKEVALLVDEVSHPKDYSGVQVQEYYEKLKHISLPAKMIKLADFLSHLRRLIGIYQRGEEASNPIFVENGRYTRDIIAVAETCPESGAKNIVMELAKELSELHQKSPVWGV